MNKTIVVNITGGLGNQMFQYAAAKSLALTLKYNLLVCTDSYEYKKQHNGYELENVFNINTPKICKKDLKSFLGIIVSNYQARQIISKSRICSNINKKFITENNINKFYRNLHNESQYYYMHGYWQSENYFLENEKEVIKSFSFNNAINKCFDLSKEINNRNSISIHVRRGDYINNQKANKLHGSCSLSYYNESAKYFTKNFDDCEFYVFTDSPEWAKNNIVIKDAPVCFIHHNGSSSYLDMYLMSMCKHNIIANSTFSWWGAKLNNNKDKTIIAPRQWFAAKETPKELIPYTWILM